MDDENGLIVAEDVVEKENDQEQLVPMLKQVEETLGEVAEETLADGGYCSGQQLAEAEASGYEVLVNLGRHYVSGGFHASNFRYDEERDVCLCPLGKELTYERTKASRHKTYEVRIYRCRSHGSCPMGKKCSRDKRGRSIEIGPYHQAMVRQREKPNRELLKRRPAIVERVFAQLKWNMNFRRWMVGGLEKVKAQWALLCTVYNLRKLCKLWTDGRLVLGP